MNVGVTHQHGKVSTVPSLISAIWEFRRALNDLTAVADQRSAALSKSVRQPLVARRHKPIQPADVSRELEKVMLKEGNLLEDVNYGRVVPNDYVVELNQEHYERQYRPIERQVTDQWRDRILDVLTTANSRFGAKRYHFGGRVQVRINPVADLAPNEVRIGCEINADVAVPQPAALTACLDLLPAGPSWPLREGMMTLGRDPACDVYLGSPAIQQRRLMSGQHAHTICEHGRCRLYDGAPGGKPSVNGTFVNGRRVPLDGVDLNDGDLVVLAALDPTQPRPDTPGVAGFLFRRDCTP